MNENKINYINDNELIQFINYETPKILKDFKDFRNQLGDLTLNSENDFLEIGSKLQEYLTKSREFLSLSESTGNYINNEIIVSGIPKLNDCISRLSLDFSSSAEEIKYKEENLQKVYTQIEEIIDAFTEFKKIVKRLKMLGISTKIESSRLGTNDNGFNLLAEKVDELSSLISGKADMIFTKSELLKKELKKTVSELIVLENDHKILSELVLNNTNHSMQALNSKFKNTKQKIEINNNNFENITKNISSIVTQIQFHDITRQQLEHVKESLQEAEYEIEYAANEIPVSEKVNKLRNVNHIIGLQKEQLKNSLNEFESAVSNIKYSLVNVEKNVQAILFESIDLGLDKSSSNNNILSEVKTELESVSNGLEKSAIIENDLIIAIKSVLRIVSELTEQVREIKEVGGELELIALNASIKSARTGEKGMALGVIAESIQNLSLEAKLHTEITITALKDIDEASQKLDVETKIENEDESKTSIHTTNKEINELIAAIINTQVKASEFIGSITRGVDYFKKDINETIYKLGLQNKIKSSVESIIKIITNTIEKIEKNVGKDHTSSIENEFMKKKYTMNSERQVHKKYAQGLKNSDENNLDLFQTDSDNLPNNIELF